MRRIVVVLLLLLEIAFGGFLISHRLPSVASTSACVNIPAFPDYVSSKSETDAIAAINNARSQEKLPALSLPGNYYRLGPAQQQLILINLERTDRHLPPLRMDPTLAQMALAYSRQMSDLHFFSHTSPISGTFTNRINSNPALVNHYSLAAENLAGNPVAGAGPIYEYMYDDAAENCGHRSNILDPNLTLVGINWVPNREYGSISAQEFLTSAPWNPYISLSPDTIAPSVIAGQPLLKKSILTCRALATDNVGVVRITWFLDRVGNQVSLGPTLSLDISHLAPGRHILLVYAVDGTQNYSMSSQTFTIGP